MEKYVRTIPFLPIFFFQLILYVKKLGLSFDMACSISLAIWIRGFHFRGLIDFYTFAIWILACNGLLQGSNFLWSASWDDWVPEDRLRKLTEENKELAKNLKKEMDSLRQRAAPKTTTTSSKKKIPGSDLSSARGSEERNSSVPATGRGQKRGRDYEIEKVGLNTFSSNNHTYFPEESDQKPFEEPCLKRMRTRAASTRRAKSAPATPSFVREPPPAAAKTPLTRKLVDTRGIEHEWFLRANGIDPGAYRRAIFFRGHGRKAGLMLAGIPAETGIQGPDPKHLQFAPAATRSLKNKKKKKKNVVDRSTRRKKRSTRDPQFESQSPNSWKTSSSTIGRTSPKTFPLSPSRPRNPSTWFWPSISIKKKAIADSVPLTPIYSKKSSQAWGNILTSVLDASYYIGLSVSNILKFVS